MQLSWWPWSNSGASSLQLLFATSSFLRDLRIRAGLQPRIGQSFRASSETARNASRMLNNLAIIDIERIVSISSPCPGAAEWYPFHPPETQDQASSNQEMFPFWSIFGKHLEIWGWLRNPAPPKGWLNPYESWDAYHLSTGDSLTRPTSLGCRQHLVWCGWQKKQDTLLQMRDSIQNRVLKTSNQ